MDDSFILECKNFSSERCHLNWCLKYNRVVYSRSSNSIIYSTLFHYNINKKKNNWYPTQPMSVEFAPSLHVCMEFPQVVWFPPISQKCACYLRLLACLNCPSLSECGYVCECTSDGRDILSRVSSHLVLWAAKRGSSHPQRLTRISRLENNDLTYFHSSFLNVCISYIYFKVIIRNVLGLHLKVWWCSCDHKYATGT